MNSIPANSIPLDLQNMLIFWEIRMMGIQTAGHSHILQGYYYVDIARQALAMCPRLASSSPSLCLSVSSWDDKVTSEWMGSHLHLNTSQLGSEPNHKQTGLQRNDRVAFTDYGNLWKYEFSGIISQHTFTSHWQRSQKYYWMERLLKQAVILSSINYDKINLILGFLDN